MFEPFRELKHYYRLLGKLRFSIYMGGVVTYNLGFAALTIWLSDKIGWPDAYGFHCSGRGCWFVHLTHSGKLLRGSEPLELALFAALWFTPAVAIVSSIAILAKRRWHRYRNRIRPMDHL